MVLKSARLPATPVQVEFGVAILVLVLCSEAMFLQVLWFSYLLKDRRFKFLFYNFCTETVKNIRRLVNSVMFLVNAYPLDSDLSVG